MSPIGAGRATSFIQKRGVTGEGSIWVGEYNERKIYEMTVDGSVVSSFGTISELGNSFRPGGVSTDSSGCFWVAEFLGGQVQRLDNEGYYSGQQVATGAEGVALDSSGCIWVSEGGPDEIQQWTQSDSLVSSFASPVGPGTPRGVGIDADESIWHTGYGVTNMYKLTRGGSQISTFSIGTDYMWGVTVDDNGCVWAVDASSDSIYKFTTGGSQVTTFLAPGTRPTGLTYF